MEATELTNKTEIDETERWAGPGKGVTLALYFWPLHIWTISGHNLELAVDCLNLEKRNYDLVKINLLSKLKIWRVEKKFSTTTRKKFFFVNSFYEFLW